MSRSHSRMAVGDHSSFFVWNEAAVKRIQGLIIFKFMVTLVIHTIDPIHMKASGNSARNLSPGFLPLSIKFRGSSGV